MVVLLKLSLPQPASSRQAARQAAPMRRAFEVVIVVRLLPLGAAELAETGRCRTAIFRVLSPLYIHAGVLSNEFSVSWAFAPVHLWYLLPALMEKAR